MQFGIVIIGAAIVGLVQCLISWLGELHDTFLTASHLPGFGYFRTVHWSITYVLLVPLIYASSLIGLRSIRDLPTHLLSHSKRSITSGCLAAILVSYLIVGNEVRDTLVPPEHYCQWNNLSDVCMEERPDTESNFFRTALYLLSYTNYYFACFLFASFLFTVTVLLLCFPRDLTSPELVGQLRAITNLLKLAIAAYLAYLVLLRSAKVDLLLSARGVPLKECEDFLEIGKCARPYFEAMSGGLLINIAQGLMLVSIALVCQKFLSQVSEPQRNSRKDVASAAIEFLASWEKAYLDLGTKFRIALGGGMFGIALPPPNYTILLSILLILPGFLMVKRALSKRTEETE